MADGLLTMHEASFRLRCSIRHVRRLIEAGRLEGLRDDDGMQRVVEASLVAFERTRAGAFARAHTRTQDTDGRGPGSGPTPE